MSEWRQVKMQAGIYMFACYGFITFYDVKRYIYIMRKKMMFQ